MKSGAKSLYPQGRAYTRALKSEKSLSPPIPVGGGGPWIQMTGALQLMEFQTTTKDY